MLSSDTAAIWLLALAHTIVTIIPDMTLKVLTTTFTSRVSSLKPHSTYKVYAVIHGKVVNDANSQLEVNNCARVKQWLFCRAPRVDALQDALRMHICYMSTSLAAEC